jgi:hypothetical protein
VSFSHELQVFSVNDRLAITPANQAGVVHSENDFYRQPEVACQFLQCRIALSVKFFCVQGSLPYFNLRLAQLQASCQIRSLFRRILKLILKTAVEVTVETLNSHPSALHDSFRRSNTLSHIWVHPFVENKMEEPSFVLYVSSSPRLFELPAVAR